MKRRSARPFSVEIKQTRTSGSSSTDGAPQSRKKPDLWGGRDLAEIDRPSDRLPAIPRVDVVRPEAPARRVLPSLVPTFAVLSEPEGGGVADGPVVERLPRVRRPKRSYVPVVEAAAEPLVSAPTSVPGDDADGPTATPPLRVPGRPVPIPAHRARDARGASALRPGERWKRRLPPALR